MPFVTDKIDLMECKTKYYFYIANIIFFRSDCVCISVYCVWVVSVFCYTAKITVWTYVNVCLPSCLNLNVCLL